MTREKLFIFDERRGQVVGRFHELRKPGQRNPPRRVLCSIDDLRFKSTARGLIRRGEREQLRMLSRLREEKLEYLRAEEKSRAEAESRAEENGLPVQGVMQEWLNEVGAYQKNVTLSEYRRTCQLYIEACGNHPVKDFRKHHATRFQSALRNLGLKDAGIRKHQTQLQVFLRWAYTEEHLEKPIFLSKIKVVQHGPLNYTKKDILTLQHAIERALADAPTDFQKRCASNHLRTFMLTRHAVLRCGEVLAMPLRHLLMDDSSLRIAAVPEIGWIPKTRQERIIPMNPELTKFLKDDLEKRGPMEKWFLDDGTGGRAYATNSQLSQVFRRYVRRCGLEESGRKPLHALRSTGITEMLAARGKLDFVMRIAGHANPQTTLNHYVDADRFDLRDTVKLLSE